MCLVPSSALRLLYDIGPAIPPKHLPTRTMGTGERWVGEGEEKCCEKDVFEIQTHHLASFNSTVCSWGVCGSLLPIAIQCGATNTLSIGCSASIRKSGFVAELNQVSSIKSPEPQSLKRPEDLKNTLLVSTILQTHAIQRGRITVILHSPVVLTPRQRQQSSPQWRGTCVAAKSFPTRVPLPCTAKPPASALCRAACPP